METKVVATVVAQLEAEVPASFDVNLDLHVRSLATADAMRAFAHMIVASS
jgi:hypothetical protein